MTNEQAIELLMSVKWNANIDEQEDKALSMAIEALSTQSERKKGKWIDLGFNEEMWGEAFECSICGELMIGISNYCFNCGAEMEVRT